MELFLFLKLKTDYFDMWHSISYLSVVKYKQVIHMYEGFLQTPIGYLCLRSDDIGITEVFFCEKAKEEHENEWIQVAKQQLLEYFKQERKEFDVPLHIVTGTPFQRRCWDALCKIPYGETRSYFDQACSIGNKKAVRAVGGANHHNPITIIIPCHRIIAKNGTLCGYGGGVLKKEYLLELEMGDDE